MFSTDLLAAFPFAFPIFFVAMWLTVTTVLSMVSGWRILAAKFPNRPDATVLATFWFCSGVMGAGVNYGGCLTIQPCQEGLRVSVWKLFAPFDRPILAPWSEVRPERRRRFIVDRVVLRFGAVEAGHLEISPSLAERIADAAGARWTGSISLR